MPRRSCALVVGLGLPVPVVMVVDPVAPIAFEVLVILVGQDRRSHDRAGREHGVEMEVAVLQRFPLAVHGAYGRRAAGLEPDGPDRSGHLGAGECQSQSELVVRVEEPGGAPLLRIAARERELAVADLQLVPRRLPVAEARREGRIGSRRSTWRLACRRAPGSWALRVTPRRRVTATSWVFDSGFRSSATSPSG